MRYLFIIINKSRFIIINAFKRKKSKLIIILNYFI